MVASQPASVTTLVVARALGYLLVVATSAGLLWYLRAFALRLLAAPYRDRWRYLAVGVGAVGVYGVAGLAELFVTAGATPFRRGATLFVFLFCAVGMRGVHRSVEGAGRRRSRPVAPAAVVALVAAWWATHLFAAPVVVAAVEVAGLLAATSFTVYHAVGTVDAAEGTSVAAVVRQFLPALLALAVVGVAEHLGVAVPGAAPAGRGAALVGTAVAGAFLFSTMTAIRQQGGEVERMYDETTWRADGSPEARPADGDDD
ncbi:MAG: hypothetical protein A07HB70_02061 [uncultured archaeon A07HB70]|nr:MAG: hypothetical protein A07HB70_02061 [uncultured archaeon A07HB70]